jgi:sulfur carrier protein
MPEIRVNGELRAVELPLNVAQLVAQVAGTEDRRGLAAARNGDIVPRSAWDTTAVAPGDSYEIAAPFAGG